MEAGLLVVAGALGLVFGSFANVVIARVPSGQSVVRPRSACPQCGAAVRGRDNVPVVSWLALGRRCRDCDAPISGRYPLVEVTGAGLFVAVAARFGLDWALPAYWLFAWTLLCLTAIDLEHYRIPNRLTYPLTPVLAVLLVAAAFVSGEPDVALRTVFGSLAGFATLLLIALINPRGMGLGDVKLAAFLGLGLGYLGWGHLVLGLFASFLLGGLVAVVVLLARLRDRKGHIPFGPWLAAGSMLTVLAGEPLIDWYLRLSGLR